MPVHRSPAARAPRVAALAATLTLALLARDAGARSPFEVPLEPSSPLCPDSTLIRASPLPHVIDDALDGTGPGGRVRFYRFLTTAEALAVELGPGPGSSEPLREPRLGVFDSDCRRIASSGAAADGPSAGSARLTVVRPATGLLVVAVAGASDEGFDGSGDGVGDYRLRIESVEPPRPEPPPVTVTRAADGRVDVEISPQHPPSAGYDVYVDGRYLATARPPPDSRRFRVDGPAGEYCVVRFVEYGDVSVPGDGTRHSTCGERFAVGPGGPPAGAPSMPRELRATVHSPGVAELSWLPAIDDGRVVGYRVRRDRVAIAETAGRSLFERGLDPLHTYRYRVSAVDEAGNEGAPARIEVRPSAAAEVPPLGGDGDAPAAPGRLRGVRHSAGVVEIHWAPSPDHARLAGYEVRRGTERVAFHRGASHFEPVLARSGTHVWSVTAVGRGGERSAARTLRYDGERFVVPVPIGTPPLINRDSYAALLDHVFALYVGERYNGPLLDQRSAAEAFPDATAAGGITDAPLVESFACEGGGTATRTASRPPGDFGTVEAWRFDGCRSGETVRDGPLTIRRHTRGPVFSSTGFRIGGPTAPWLRFDGDARRGSSQSSRFDSIRSWRTVDVAIEARTVDGDLSIPRASTSFASGRSRGTFHHRAWLRGELEVRSEATGGTLLRARTPEEFHVALPIGTNPREARRRGEPAPAAHWWYFPVGTLELLAEDGSRVLLDADTGELGTVRITLDDGRDPSGRTVETFVAPWDRWRRRLAFESDPEWAGNLPPAYPDADPRPAIRADNHVALLDHVFDLVSGGVAAAPLAVARRFLSVEPGADATLDRGLVIERLDCPDEGTATVRRFDREAASDGGRRYRIDFAACRAEGYRFDGTLRGVEARGRGGGATLEADGLTWERADGARTRFVGRVSNPPPPTAADDCLWAHDAADFEGFADDRRAYLETSGERPQRFDDEVPSSGFPIERPGTRFELGPGDGRVRLFGAFDVVSRASGGHAMQVLIDSLRSVDDDGRAAADGGFAAGGLHLRADDGSELYLGDFVRPSVGRILIVNRDGRFATEAPWTSWRERLGEARRRVCGVP